MQAFRDALGGFRDFIETRYIITMDTPGLYGKVAKEGYFNVTLPAKAWTAKQRAGPAGDDSAML